MGPISVKKKIKIVTVLLIVAVVCLLITLLSIYWPKGWQKLEEIPQYQGILDAPITQVMLVERGEQSVTFTDQDLLQRWEEGLSQLEVKQLPERQGDAEYLQAMESPGARTAYVYLGEKEYNFLIGGEVLLTQYGYYSFRPSEGLPYEETFDAAVQRHGLDDP